ncbi:hypothetical protein KBD13_00875 [Patescibacteria group bacterium]|nr:hypothetical protein [Patescibacteria group bacterium]MDQ5919856.1 hypothetical protein [Patescibacteria group bacterium]
MSFDAPQDRRPPSESTREELLHMREILAWRLDEVEEDLVRGYLWKDLDLPRGLVHDTGSQTLRREMRHCPEALFEVVSDALHQWMDPCRQVLLRAKSVADAQDRDTAIEAYATMMHYVAQQPLARTMRQGEDQWQRKGRSLQELDEYILQRLQAFRSMLARQSLWVDVVSDEAIERGEPDWLAYAIESGALPTVQMVHTLTRKPLEAESYSTIPKEVGLAVQRGYFFLENRASLSPEERLSQQRTLLAAAKQGASLRVIYDEARENMAKEWSALQACIQMIQAEKRRSSRELVQTGMDLAQQVQDCAEGLIAQQKRVQQAEVLAGGTALPAREKRRVDIALAGPKEELARWRKRLREAIRLRDLGKRMIASGVSPSELFQEGEARLFVDEFLARALHACRACAEEV